MAPPYGVKFPYKTSHCGNGWHEGTRPRNHKDQPLPSCTQWEKCVCDCHAQITKMFEMSGLPRVAMPCNPDYSPPPGPRLVMPTREEVEAARARRAGMPAPVTKSLAPGLPVDTVRAAAPAATPSGARSPGALERQVKEACDLWLLGDVPAEVLTPKAISDQIGPSDDGKFASVGAIGAVLDRWVEVGFATVERKPVRFVGYTVEGMQRGLDALRADHVAAKKAVQNKQLRGIRT